MRYGWRKVSPLVRKAFEFLSGKFIKASAVIAKEK